MAKAKKAAKQERFTKATLRVTCEGIVPIMFDAYRGKVDNIAVEKKLYLDADRRLVLPAENVMSFLGSDSDKSIASILQGRGRGEYLRAIACFVTINPDSIPFLRDGSPIHFGGFDKATESDSESGCWIQHGKALTKQGTRLIPQDKERPVLPLPWTLEFTAELWSNDVLTPDILTNYFVEGGMRVGFGTHRPRYGRFVTKIDTEKVRD